jgi:23S rRNA (cytosine1962-C5)-methyltransferase
MPSMERRPPVRLSARPERGDVPAERAPRTGIRADALQAFAARLDKNARHWGKWARRRGIGAWRVYDRDLPEFPLAIDCYSPLDPELGLRVHLQEIETGWQQEEGEHREWLAAVAGETARVLGVPAGAIAVKERRRRQGRTQHGKTGARGREFTVAEGGLSFLVNLEAYLDTGLFLDHRALRAIVRERAAGRRILNLFAYTGSFTVYAAAGGAPFSDTVDLSNTYLDWAGRNFALNGMDLARHALFRADAREWLEQAQDEGRRYGLIVLDPPSFSNSKAMDGVLDVQRDHGWLIANARGLLEAGGELYFSPNLRAFALAQWLAADPRTEEITGETLPADFRDRRIHRAWRFAR